MEWPFSHTNSSSSSSTYERMFVMSSNCIFGRNCWNIYISVNACWHNFFDKMVAHIWGCLLGLSPSGADFVHRISWLRELQRPNIDILLSQKYAFGLMVVRMKTTYRNVINRFIYCVLYHAMLSRVVVPTCPLLRRFACFLHFFSYSVSLKFVHLCVWAD